MQGKGFRFHSESGEIISVTEGRHIEEICREPGKFGLTVQGVEAEFQRCDEPLNREGQAREALILHVVRTSPWVRIREYLAPGGSWWSGNCRDFGVQGPRILEFLRRFFPGWEAGTPVRIDEASGRVFSGTWAALEAEFSQTPEALEDP